MQLIIDIKDKSLYEKVISFLKSLKGIEVKEKVDEKRVKELDFSSFKIDSFKDIDGLTYQKKIRDEW